MTESSGSADERLVIMLEARITDFEKKLAQAEKTGTRTYRQIQAESRRMANQMEADALAGSRGLVTALGSVSGKIGGFAAAFVGGLAGGAITAAFAGFSGGIRGTIADIGDLNDAATRIGVSTDFLQGLQHGFKLQGVDIEETTGALEKFVDGIGKAGEGTGTLKAAFDANGLSLRTSNGDLKDTATLLKEFADLVNKTPDAAAKMSLVTDAFGRGGKAIVNALDGGAPAIDAMIQAAKDGGYVLDESLVAKGAALDDSFDKLAGRIKVLFETATVESAQFFADSAEGWAMFAEDVAKAASGMGLGAQPVVDQQTARDLDTLRLAADSTREALANVMSGFAGNPNLQSSVVIIGEISNRIGQLTADLQSNKIGSDEFKIGVADSTDEAAKFLASLQEIDHVKLNGAYETVAALRDLMQSLADKAAGAAAQMAAVGNGPHAGGDDLTAPKPYDTGIDRGTDGTFSGITFGPGGANLKPGSTAPRHGGGGGGGGGGGSSNDLDALMNDLQTQREAVTEWYTESEALLATATDAQLEQLGGRHSAIERLEQEHQQRLLGIQGDGQGDSLQQTAGFFGALASAVQQGGAKSNKAFQAFAAAEALINAWRAGVQVLADPKLSFWAKVPAALSIVGAGMGMVKAITGGGGGGGGRGGSSGGGSGSGPAAAVAAAAPDNRLNVILQAIDPAHLYQGQGIIDLLNALQKEAGTRGMNLGGVGG